MLKIIYKKKSCNSQGHTQPSFLVSGLFYYFYSSDFLVHNWNLLGSIYLLTKVFDILGGLFSWYFDFVNILNQFF